MSCNFEEKSGLVTTKTGWGNWGQTLEEILIEVDLGREARSRDIKCAIKTRYLSLHMGGECLIQVWYYRIAFCAFTSKRCLTGLIVYG